MSIINVLSKDKKLAKVIKSIGEGPLHRLTPTGEVMTHLIDAIISQQLSTKVAQVISDRFWQLMDDHIIDKIISMPHEDLRACGLSNSKANYIRNIATFWQENKIKDKDFVKMSNEEILLKLTQIKGVGKWTAEMVLMFCLGREDVFAVDDYGIQTAMKKIYNIDAAGKQLRDILIMQSSKWKPYRTYACLYLWAYKDN